MRLSAAAFFIITCPFATLRSRPDPSAGWQPASFHVDSNGISACGAAARAITASFIRAIYNSTTAEAAAAAAVRITALVEHA